MKIYVVYNQESETVIGLFTDKEHAEQASKKEVERYTRQIYGEHAYRFNYRIVEVQEHELDVEANQ
jgi:hypothetical protein